MFLEEMAQNLLDVRPCDVLTDHVVSSFPFSPNTWAWITLTLSLRRGIHNERHNVAQQAPRLAWSCVDFTIGNMKSVSSIVEPLALLSGHKEKGCSR